MIYLIYLIYLIYICRWSAWVVDCLPLLCFRSWSCFCVLCFTSTLFPPPFSFGVGLFVAVFKSFFGEAIFCYFFFRFWRGYLLSIFVLFFDVLHVLHVGTREKQGGRGHSKGFVRDSAQSEVIHTGMERNETVYGTPRNGIRHGTERFRMKRNGSKRYLARYGMT